MAFTLRTIGTDNTPGSTEIEVGDLLLLSITCRTSDTITVTGVTDDQGNTWAQAGRHAAAGQFVEVWWAICGTKANTTVTPTYSATPTSPIVVWDGFVPPAEFEVGDTAGANSSGTTHSCGAVDAPADSLMLTVSSVTLAFSATPNEDYTELLKGTRNYQQYRLPTGAVSADDGAWTSGASETVASLQVVFQEPSGGGGNVTLEADAGAVTISGTAAGLTADRVLGAEAGAATISGTAAGLTADRVLSAEAGAAAVSGTAAGLTADRVLSAEAGAVAIAGTDATLEFDGGGFSIDADAGAVSIAGTAAALTVARMLSAEPGAVIIAGTDADLLASGVPNPEILSFVSAITRTVTGELAIRRSVERSSSIQRVVSEETER